MAPCPGKCDNSTSLSVLLLIIRCGCCIHYVSGIVHATCNSFHTVTCKFSYEVSQRPTNSLLNKDSSHLSLSIQLNALQNIISGMVHSCQCFSSNEVINHTITGPIYGCNKRWYGFNLFCWMCLMNWRLLISLSCILNCILAANKLVRQFWHSTGKF